jgi:Domain of unknown function (DUF4865)
MADPRISFRKRAAVCPVYLWDDTDAMGKFLWGGDGFGGTVRDFGRPVGQTWVGIGVGAHPWPQSTVAPGKPCNSRCGASHPEEAGEHFEVLHLSAPTGV